jgi:hypothetical protein
MTTQFTRSDIVREGYDIAYVLLWNMLGSNVVRETAKQRGFCEKDVERIQKQVQKITLRLKSQAHDFSRSSKECWCGSTIASLIDFFGADYLNSHITDCPQCNQRTLHVSDESARCADPICMYSSGVDAEGNHYVNGEIVSNGGKSIAQLRGEYFAGEGLL